MRDSAATCCGWLAGELQTKAGSRLWTGSAAGRTIKRTTDCGGGAFGSSPLQTERRFRSIS